VKPTGPNMVSEGGKAIVSKASKVVVVRKGGDRRQNESVVAASSTSGTGILSQTERRTDDRSAFYLTSVPLFTLVFRPTNCTK
jgi:hypothetical protein